jgi:hypothetical protein
MILQCMEWTRLILYNHIWNEVHNSKKIWIEIILLPVQKAVFYLQKCAGILIQEINETEASKDTQLIRGIYYILYIYIIYILLYIIYFSLKCNLLASQPFFLTTCFGRIRPSSNVFNLVKIVALYNKISYRVWIRYFLTKINLLY